MNLFKDVVCLECYIEYKVIWDADKYGDPCKCSSCGTENIEVINSGFMA